MTISTYSMTGEQLTELSNQIRELFIDAMLRQGIIDEQQAHNMQQYVFMVVKRGFLGKFWDKLWNPNGNESRIIVLKVSNCELLGDQS